MGDDSQRDVTRLLIGGANGAQRAAAGLTPPVYAALHRRAAAYLRRERPGLTLQATALVHETYLRLIDQNSVHWRNRLHFFALSAKVMRRILVDHARGHLTAKRGGGMKRIELEGSAELSAEKPEHLIVLDEALSHLRHENLQLSQIVELRFFGGFKNEEIAELLDISVPTITRRWRLAKAWLYRRLTAEYPGHGQ